MITVHHLNHSRSQRVLWLLEELQVDYEIRRYERDPKTMLAPPELRAVHPLGKSPVITDGDTTVAESGAIVEYLVETYGQGRLQPPPGTPAALRYRYWMHYAEGSLMPLLVMKLVFRRLPTAVPLLLRPLVKGVSAGAQGRFLDPQIRTHLDFMEGELGQDEWFAGKELTAADIQMSFPVQAAAARAGLNRSHPRLAAFLKRVQARPAYQRALDKGGPFDLLS